VISGYGNQGIFILINAEEKILPVITHITGANPEDLVGLGRGGGAFAPQTKSPPVVMV
jgi:hypothetical protein